MNVLATQRGEPRTTRRCSRTSRRGGRPRSSHITGALVREAGRVSVPVPLHTALYAPGQGPQASWEPRLTLQCVGS